MSSSNPVVVKNLLLRFPETTRADVEFALEKSRGHGGKAGNLLCDGLRAPVEMREVEQALEKDIVRVASAASSEPDIAVARRDHLRDNWLRTGGFREVGRMLESHPGFFPGWLIEERGAVLQVRSLKQVGSQKLCGHHCLHNAATLLHAATAGSVQEASERVAPLCDWDSFNERLQAHKNLLIAAQQGWNERDITEGGHLRTVCCGTSHFSVDCR